MKKTTTLILLQCSMAMFSFAQTYNKLPIPEAVYGDYNSLTNVRQYGLIAHEGFTSFLPTGNQTVTAGYNRNSFLGPTLFLNNGDSIQMTVLNRLNTPTTVHWHGIHLPAVMDGGPYQVIPVGATWQPYWKVKDHAATYWYHSHLMDETDKQVTEGLAGLIIVKDDKEANLPLPRKYGVDDIPLIITDRTIDTTNNQFIVADSGNFEITNGVINAQDTLPSQVVRLRILNASVFRFYNFGFSNNLSFKIITTDGGLVNSPILCSRALLGPGERIEILVDLSGKKDSSFDLMAFNSALAPTQPGGFDATVNTGPLMGIDFPCLHINVTGANADSAATSLSYSLTTLADNKFPKRSSANLQRNIQFDHLIDSAGNFYLTLNDTPFVLGNINYRIGLNDTEIWSLTNPGTLIPSSDPNYPFVGIPSSHAFHIHDIQFHVLDRFQYDTITKHYDIRMAPMPTEQGWKDDITVDMGDSVTFITVFSDYSDSLWPYMYHCHMLAHEDAAMMGDFVVVKNSTSTNAIKNHNLLDEEAAKIYPNPAPDRLFVELRDNTTSVYYITVYDAVGRTKYMLPRPKLADGLNVGDLAPGNYFLKIMDTRGSIILKQFTKL